MTNNSTTPIEVPDEFKAWAEVKANNTASDQPIALRGHITAEFYSLLLDAYRHLNSKPSGLRWVRASDKLPLEAELKRENNICIRFHGIDYQSGVFSDGQFHIMIAGKWWPTVSDLKYIEWLDESPSTPTLLEEKTETDAQGSTGMEKKVHPVYKGWNSMKLIGRVKDRFQELIRKGWNWTGFYHGWLEGRAEMLDEMKKEWDAPLSAPTVEPGTKWVKCSDRMPILPNPLPADTPDERGVLFVNRKHSAAQFWFPSYGYTAEAQFPLEANVDRKLYNIGWGREEWEWLEEIPSTVEPAAETEKKTEDEKSYFVAQCEHCGYKGSSKTWEGFGQIADTGDYGDGYCPVCGEISDCDEADDDLYIDQSELLLKRLAEWRKKAEDFEAAYLSEKSLNELYAKAPSIQQEAEKKYSRSEIFEICGAWSENLLHAAQGRYFPILDLANMFSDWFDKNYPYPTQTAQQEAIPEAGLTFGELREWISDRIKPLHGLNTISDYAKGQHDAFSDAFDFLREHSSPPSVKTEREKCCNDCRYLQVDNSPDQTGPSIWCSKDHFDGVGSQEEADMLLLPNNCKDFQSSQPSPAVQEEEVPKMSDQLAAESDIAAIEFGKKNGQTMPVDDDEYDNSCDLTAGHEAGQSWMYRKMMEGEVTRANTRYSDTVLDLRSVQKERDDYRKALEYIASPIKAIQKAAKEKGFQVNGLMAMNLSRDPDHLSTEAAIILAQYPIPQTSTNETGKG